MILSRITFLGCLAALMFHGNAQDAEWLAVCSRCPSPIVYKKTGTGTANSVAEARMTPQQFRVSCSEQGLHGAAHAKCVKEEMAADAGKVYRASANCTTGALTAIDGKQYTFAGVWSNDDIGGGRTRWRNAATGQIVGRDNASGGLGLAQQWEVLCPGPLKIAQASNPVAPARTTAPPVCNGSANCTEVNSFAATLSDFRTSTAGGSRLVTANVRFENKLARPLILGYLSGSGVALDDRGNRLVMNERNGLRGMGFIRGNRVDPKFVIGAGQTADARVEFNWHPRGNEIFGTTYNLEFTVREIVPVTATQFRIGLEHPLKWAGLGSAEVSGGSAAPPVDSGVRTVAAIATAVPAATDNCQGLERCFSTEAFTAQVTQVVSSMARNNQVLGLKVRFRNLTNEPLVLAYKYGTSLAIDNHGQRLTQQGLNYARGIGVSRSGKTGADFVIAPGQTRDAAFEVSRYVGKTLVGTGFTWDFTVEQLEVLPANQLRVLREFSLSFPDLAAATPAAAAAPAGGQQLNDAAQKLQDLFKRRKK